MGEGGREIRGSGKEPSAIEEAAAILLPPGHRKGRVKETTIHLVKRHDIDKEQNPVKAAILGEGILPLAPRGHLAI